MNEEYRENGGLLGGKGFYIALMLCVSVIALSAWLIVNGDGEEEAEQVSVTNTPSLQLQVSEWDIEPLPVEVMETEEPDAAEADVSEDAGEAVTEVAVQADPPTREAVSHAVRSYVWPVIGEVDMDFSMDALAYNETMGDWRTHDGIDIAAEAGTYVRAATDGTVADVYEDVLYGTTVVIDHGAGLVSYYANLQAQPVVKAGDMLLAGDVIGGVGETALCETAQAPHVHFAMSLNDQSVNPRDYLPML